jgi:hypothetical protein
MFDYSDRKTVSQPKKEKRTISLAQIQLLKYKRQQLLKKRRERKQKKYDGAVLKISNNIDYKNWTIAERTQARQIAAKKLGVSPTPPRGCRL